MHECTEYTKGTDRDESNRTLTFQIIFHPVICNVRYLLLRLLWSHALHPLHRLSPSRYELPSPRQNVRLRVGKPEVFAASAVGKNINLPQDSGRCHCRTDFGDALGGHCSLCCWRYGVHFCRTDFEDVLLTAWFAMLKVTLRLLPPRLGDMQGKSGLLHFNYTLRMRYPSHLQIKLVLVPCLLVLGRRISRWMDQPSWKS